MLSWHSRLQKISKRSVQLCGGLTDNKFRTTDCLMRWRWIIHAGSEVGIRIGVRIARFSSDRDPGAMHHLSFQEGVHTWPWFDLILKFTVPIQDRNEKNKNCSTATQKIQPRYVAPDHLFSG